MKLYAVLLLQLTPMVYGQPELLSGSHKYIDEFLTGEDYCKQLLLNLSRNYTQLVVGFLRHMHMSPSFLVGWHQLLDHALGSCSVHWDRNNTRQE